MERALKIDGGGAVALSTIQAAMRGCMRCPALVRSRSCVVPGDGAAPAAIAFVGIAPGRLGGDRTGLPFTGDRSGEVLRRMIDRAALGPVFVTNLVRCNPRDAGGRNRDPSPREIANCRGHLDAELALVRPRIVVCLGRLAWRELAGRDAPFDPRRPKSVSAGGMRLFPMYHPAYVVRGACTERAYARSFARLEHLLIEIARAPD
ncbi:MAG TPA: uracil-DNA glycosylase [Candidatus Binataceae bacterium]|nr:uracil-DNA glycosylase [Candidatus Binataceae bacterium]